MSLSYTSQEKLGSSKKVVTKIATISTINIGVDDFLESNSLDNGSAQRPPQRSGSSVHFNMSSASTKATSRQSNKTILPSKVNNGNGPMHDSKGVLPSIASRGKKNPGSNLVRLQYREINPVEIPSRLAIPVHGQKQRPSTTDSSYEKPLEGKSTAILRHSSCELRENLGEGLKTTPPPLLQRNIFPRSCADSLQISSHQDRCNEFGMNVWDMNESLSKIQELIFPSKAGQEVVMRENMAFEASPIQSEDFPELEDGSMKPLCRSPLARSLSRRSNDNLGKLKDADASCVRKQRRAQSVVKGRQRKDKFHEKSQSCDNETSFREEVNRRWTKMRSSAEFSSSSLPLYADRSNSDSAASTEEDRDELVTRRRWPKVPQFFSNSTVRSCKDHSVSKSESSFLESDSSTTQMETEQSNTSGIFMDKICKSRWSKLENGNFGGDRSTTGQELATTKSRRGRKNLLGDTTMQEQQNKGFEEENEILLYKNVIEEHYQDDKECTCQPAKELECSGFTENAFRNGKDTAMIVLPTSSMSYGQVPVAQKTALIQVDQCLPQEHINSCLLFPTKEVQCISTCSSDILHLENLKELGSAKEGSFSGVDTLPNQIHHQCSEKVLPHKNLSFYFEDSSSSSESVDEKHVDSSSPKHLDLESCDAIDVQSKKSSSGILKICVQKIVDEEDKGPSSIMRASPVEEKYMHASLSTEKLCSILQYLGQVEQSNLQENLGTKGTPRGICFYSPQENGSPRAVLEHAEDAVSFTSSSQTAQSSLHLSADVSSDLRLADCNPPTIAATTVFDGVRKKVQELKYKISEQENKIAETKAENEKLIQERENHMLMEREKYRKQLDDQAAEYKVIIQHHLSVNEKMLRDKEQLSEKCCNLAGILSIAESKFDEKVKQLSEQWSRETKKAKELWAVGEKQRQKQWQEIKIKDLKETAIRGLEPHLDNLNEKHRQELAKQESRNAQELQGKLDSQNLEFRRQMCELRDHLQQERDKMLDNERLAAHARMAEVAEKFEQQAIQQRMRVATEITSQLERSEAGRREDKQFSQELLSRLQKEAAEREEILRKQMDKSVEEMAMRKDRQIEQLKSQMIATSHHFQQKFNDRVNEGMKEKENELRAKLTKERDEQIELVIEKLESEKEDLIAQNKQEFTTKVNAALALKCEVEQELKEFKFKFTELSKAMLLHKADTDGELKEAEKKVVSLRKEIQNQTRVIEELRNEVSQHETTLKNQEEVFETRLKDEQTRLQQAISDLQESNSKANDTRHRKVLLTAQNIMVEELAEVETRVRQAIVKKDVVIASLREQLLTAQRQIKATEYLLQREHNAFVRES